jgi:hypothetical protein
MKKTIKQFLAGISAICMMATVVSFSTTALAAEEDAVTKEALLNDETYMSGLLFNMRDTAKQTNADDADTLRVTLPRITYYWGDAEGTTPDLFDADTPLQLVDTSDAQYIEPYVWSYYILEEDNTVRARIGLYYDGQDCGGTYWAGVDPEVQDFFNNNEAFAIGVYNGTIAFYDGTGLLSYHRYTDAAGFFKQEYIYYNNVTMDADVTLTPLETIPVVIEGEEDDTAATSTSNAATAITTNADARRGDLNGDGVVDLIDAVSLQKVLCGLIQVTDAQIATADLNEDGNLTDVDAEAMMRILLCYDD